MQAFLCINLELVCVQDYRRLLSVCQGEVKPYRNLGIEVFCSQVCAFVEVDFRSSISRYWD